MTCNELPYESLQKTLADLHMSDFLPTTEVHTALLNDLTFLLPRIIVQYLPAYECFTNSVTWHINHKHTDDMKKKSEVVNMWYISYISIIWFIARWSLKR